MEENTKIEAEQLVEEGLKKQQLKDSLQYNSFKSLQYYSFISDTKSCKIILDNCINSREDYIELRPFSQIYLTLKTVKYVFVLGIEFSNKIENLIRLNNIECIIPLINHSTNFHLNMCYFFKELKYATKDYEYITIILKHIIYFEKMDPVNKELLIKKLDKYIKSLEEDRKKWFKILSVTDNESYRIAAITLLNKLN